MSAESEDKIAVTNHGKFDFLTYDVFEGPSEASGLRLPGGRDTYVSGNRKASKGDIISIRTPASLERLRNIGKHMICKVVAYTHEPHIYKARIL